MNQVCRHLGVPGDEQIRYSYPHSLHVCYADRDSVSEFLPVDLDHQREYCLSANRVVCPIYLRRAAAVHGEGRRKRYTFLEFFDLREEPFSIVPQPRFLCESRAQQQAHAGLHWVLEQRQGLGVLRGPVGSGKTLLCRAIAEELAGDERYVLALILTPSHRTEYAFMTDLLSVWGVNPRRQRSLRDLEAAAYEFLTQAVFGDGKTAVLIVDEAQTLPRRVLQQVCKLLNWQDGGTQMLQVILAGQPSLRARMAHVSALRDRVVVDYALVAMNPTEVYRMITERLRRAGRRGDLFAPSAAQLIYQESGGMPRRVTILCLLSMWFAYEQGIRYIAQDVVQAVVEQGRSDDLLSAHGPKLADAIARWSAGESRDYPVWIPSFLRRVWVRVFTPAG